MIYTFDSLKELFPGDWKEFTDQKITGYELRSSCNRIIIAYTDYGDGVEFLDCYDLSSGGSGSYDNATLDQAKNFYKKHFKLAAFR